MGLHEGELDLNQINGVKIYKFNDKRKYIAEWKNMEFVEN